MPVGICRAMNNLAKSRGIKFHLVIYPLFYKDMCGRYPFKRIHDFLMDVCERHQVTCYDAHELFRDYYSLKRFIIHPVDYHPNGLANKRVVDFLGRQKNFLSDPKEAENSAPL